MCEDLFEQTENFLLELHSRQEKQRVEEEETAKQEKLKEEQRQEEEEKAAKLKKLLEEQVGIVLEYLAAAVHRSCGNSDVCMSCVCFRS